MLKDKVFGISLLISIFTHTLILFPLRINLFHFPKPSLKSIEIKYAQFKIKPSPQLSILKDRSIISKKDIFLTFSLKDFFRKNTPRIQKDTLSFKKTQIKKVELPLINSAKKIKNPIYLNYYQKIREKIKKYAYLYYKRFEEGEVYLSFVISSDGTLKTLKIHDEKSSQSSYLKNIALRSIKDASPFLPFPQQLDYPELSFNIIISFQLE